MFSRSDSKTLTEEKRDEIFDKIHAATDKIGWIVHILSPNYISNSMLRRFVSAGEILENSKHRHIYSLTSLLCQLWDLAESWRYGGVALEWGRHILADSLGGG